MEEPLQKTCAWVRIIRRSFDVARAGENWFSFGLMHRGEDIGRSVWCSQVQFLSTSKQLLYFCRWPVAEIAVLSHSETRSTAVCTNSMTPSLRSPMIALVE